MHNAIEKYIHRIKTLSTPLFHLHIRKAECEGK